MVAVVATSYSAAVKARDALKITWDLGPNAKVSSESIFADYARKAAGSRRRHRVAQGREPGRRARPRARIRRRSWTDYVAHMQMEPMNCLASVKDGVYDLYTGSQFQTMAVGAARRHAQGAAGQYPHPPALSRRRLRAAARARHHARGGPHRPRGGPAHQAHPVARGGSPAGRLSLRHLSGRQGRARRLRQGGVLGRHRGGRAPRAAAGGRTSSTSRASTTSRSTGPTTSTTSPTRWCAGCGRRRASRSATCARWRRTTPSSPSRPWWTSWRISTRSIP